MDKIIEIADKFEIPVLEDAAEALGSKYKGQFCGTFGHFACLSFNGNKMITTSGGGALVCPTSEVANKTMFYATQARDDAPHYQQPYRVQLSNEQYLCRNWPWTNDGFRTPYRRKKK